VKFNPKLQSLTSSQGAAPWTDQVKNQWADWVIFPTQRAGTLPIS
jgi:hypothetical protein